MLRYYEEISGQLINKSKNFFYSHEKTPLIFPTRLRKLTGIRQGEYPFTLVVQFFMAERIKSILKKLQGIEGGEKNSFLAE